MFLIQLKKKLTRFKEFIREEKGAVSVIEAAAVYPVVILGVAALIYMGMFVFEVSYLDARAEKAAAAVAKTISFTGYDELGDIYTDSGLRREDSKPDRACVEKACASNRAYRYLVNGEADERFVSGIAEYSSGLLFSPGDITCSIEVERRLFDRQVNVTVEKGIRMPGVLRSIGIASHRRIRVCASAVSEDPAEFVRNTDLVLNAAELAGRKTGVSEKLSVVRRRISEILEKVRNA